MDMLRLRDVSALLSYYYMDISSLDVERIDLLLFSKRDEHSGVFN